jgi:hypothetical protein
MLTIRASAQVVGLCTAIVICLALVDPAKATGEPNVVLPGTEVLGKTQGEWADNWSQWVWSFPSDTFPITDETGASCGLRQTGGVWFLAGSFVDNVEHHRTCSIPHGKYIFFPIFNTLSFSPEFPEQGDVCNKYASKVDRIRCDANNDMVASGADRDPNSRQPGPVILEATIDGKHVRDPFAYRNQSSPGGFKFFVRDGSILTEAPFSLPRGPRFPAVADGYWIMLSPLPLGDHLIHIFAKNEDGGVLDVTWSVVIIR